MTPSAEFYPSTPPTAHDVEQIDIRIPTADPVDQSDHFHSKKKHLFPPQNNSNSSCLAQVRKRDFERWKRELKAQHYVQNQQMFAKNSTSPSTCSSSSSFWVKDHKENMQSTHHQKLLNKMSGNAPIAFSRRKNVRTVNTEQRWQRAIDRTEKMMRLLGNEYEDQKYKDRNISLEDVVLGEREDEQEPEDDYRDECEEENSKGVVTPSPSLIESSSVLSPLFLTEGEHGVVNTSPISMPLPNAVPNMSPLPPTANLSIISSPNFQPIHSETLLHPDSNITSTAFYTGTHMMHQPSGGHNFQAANAHSNGLQQNGNSLFPNDQSQQGLSAADRGHLQRYHQQNIPNVDFNNPNHGMGGMGGGMDPETNHMMKKLGVDEIVQNSLGRGGMPPCIFG